MTLAASGAISSANINNELGRASGAAFSLTGPAERGLAQVAAGPVVLPTNFHGKAAITQTDSRGAAASHANVAYGVDAGNRWILVLAFHNDTTTNPGLTPTMTVSGVSATRLCAMSSGDGVDDAVGTAIFAAQPTGTSGTVAGSWGGLAMSIVVLRVINYTGNTPTATDTADATGSGGNMTVAIPQGGFAVALAARSFETTPAINWTNLTERGEDVVNATRRGWAWDNNMAANASLTISVPNWEASSGKNVAAVAVFAPAT